MDRRSCLFSLHVLIYCIFQTSRFSKGDEDVCPCPKIPPVNLAETPVLNCSQIGKTFRYTCKEGYMREAGTSNRITCIKDGNTVKWTDSSLRCKSVQRINGRDPANPLLTRDYTELLHDSTISTTITETTIKDATSSLTASDSLEGTRTFTSAGKFSFVTVATNTPEPFLIAENRMGDPKHIVPSCIALVCVFALAAGIIYIFWKRTSTVAQPLPVEQTPMVNKPLESKQ